MKGWKGKENQNEAKRVEALQELEMLSWEWAPLKY